MRMQSNTQAYGVTKLSFNIDEEDKWQPFIKQGVFEPPPPRPFFSISRVGPKLPPQRLTALRSQVSCLAVFPGGDRVVTGSFDHTLKLWDVASGECILTLHPGSGSKLKHHAVASGVPRGDKRVSIGSLSRPKRRRRFSASR